MLAAAAKHLGSAAAVVTGNARWLIAKELIQNRWLYPSAWLMGARNVILRYARGVARVLRL